MNDADAHDDDKSAEEPATDHAGDAAGSAGQAAGASEPPAPEGDAAATAPPPPEEASAEPSLEQQLEAAKAEIRATREKMLRVAADFDNFRKRTSRELEDARRRGQQSTLRELLPVFDNLERATQQVTEATDPVSVAQGVRMVIKLFVDTLAKLGIERVATSGQPFDPSIHDGVQHIHSDEHPAGTVAQELQPGYRMGTELIRPALVVVSKGPEPTTSDAPPEADAEADEPDASSDGADKPTDPPSDE